MPVPQQLVIDRIRDRCEEIEERFPGYRTDLVGYLAEVLGAERAADRNVSKQVETLLEAFGDLYHRRTAGGPEVPTEAEHQSADEKAEDEA
jgi:hypothetical protein